MRFVPCSLPANVTAMAHSEERGAEVGRPGGRSARALVMSLVMCSGIPSQRTGGWEVYDATGSGGPMLVRTQNGMHVVSGAPPLGTIPVFAKGLLAFVQLRSIHREKQAKRSCSQQAIGAEGSRPETHGLGGQSQKALVCRKEG